MKLPMKPVLASLSFSVPTNLHHPQSSLFLFVSTLSVNFSLSFFVLFCFFCLFVCLFVFFLTNVSALFMERTATVTHKAQKTMEIGGSLESFCD